MSKVPFNPRTAAHALRGLALGTSCSLILISEERRRRVDLARTLVDNARLIKAQRGYSSAGAAAASLQAERAADTLTREGDIALKPEFSWPGLELAEERLLRSRPVPQRRTRRSIYPDSPEESAACANSAATTESAPLDAEAPSNEKQDHVPKPALEGDDPVFRAFTNDFGAVRKLPNIPPEFVESTMSLLRKLEQEGKVRTAQRVLDRLCHHRAIDPQHFEGMSTEFFLRCALSTREHARATSRPGRRFKVAVFLFWAHRKRLTSREETTKLMEMMADLFAAEDAEHAAHSFLATSHVHFGRHQTSKLVVVPIAYLYRKQGKTAILDRWMELAEQADVPMYACYNGKDLMKTWELEDGPEEMRSPKGRRVAELGKDLRFALPFEVRDLNEEQRGLFDRMDEKAKNWEWEGVLACYSEALGVGVGPSAACLRLAVEAAVGLEDIHSPKALKLIEEAHEASVDVEPIVQSLLLARFIAIRNHQNANLTPSTRGQAFKSMQKLLETVRPYYSQPSEIVYNRMIRVCLRVLEVKEAREQCLRLAKEHWADDLLYRARSFANLVTVAVRTRDFELLQRVLEALPWKSYRGEFVCKVALKDARSTLQAMMGKARTMEESSRYEAPLASVRIALQSVKQARVATLEGVRSQIKYETFRQLKPRKGSGGGRRAGAPPDVGRDGRAEEKLPSGHMPDAAAGGPPKPPSEAAV